MKKLPLYLALACIGIVVLYTSKKHISKKEKPATAEVVEETPHYLYKILSLTNWDVSQKRDMLALSPDDDLFIHLSKENQVERIASKYWAETPYVLLKIETSKLPGKLVFEKNPGGSSKYYHLYNGSIPLSAIAEKKVVEVIQQSSSSKPEVQAL